MNKARRLAIIGSSIALFLSTTFVNAQETSAITEAPSTVNATYVTPSSTDTLNPGEKVGSLFMLNMKGDYILQRITERTYWVQKGFYSTLFYVGDQGVLLFDALDGSAQQVKQAIKSVTDLPITAIVYSHDHADHIGSIKDYLEPDSNIRLIASQETVDKQAFLNSNHPKASEIVNWPEGSFKFEDLSVEFFGFERAAHADDHGIWLLKEEKVAHIPDLINPDQPPFWAFAGSETFAYYEANINQLANLEWDFFNGGHGNIGSRADVEFYRTFLVDLKAAVGDAMGSVAWGTGVDVSKINAHTAFLSSWMKAVSEKATETLRPQYGELYGFEDATPRNAEMVALALFDYR